MKMKKLLSIVLCTAMLLGCLAVTASAAETLDEPSGSSYKENFISALLESENKWYNSDFTFIDLNFDGELEFITTNRVGATATTMPAVAYYYENGRVQKANGSFTTFLSYDGLGSPIGYYDKVSKQYMLLGHTHLHFDAANNWGGSFVLDFDNGNIIMNYYSAKEVIGDFQTEPTIHYYNGANAVADGPFGDYFSADCNEITEKEYNEINDKKLEKLVNINMKCETINSSDWEKYSASEKRQALEKSYDAFTYDRYNDDSDSGLDTDSNPIISDYTAADLVNKPLSEIVEIMGGKYEIGGNYGSVYLFNSDILPGMEFYTASTIKDLRHYGKPTSSEEEKIRAAVDNGDISLSYICLYSDSKLDDDISANMTYNELTKYLGEFDCVWDDNSLYPGYDVYNSDGEIEVFFAFPNNLSKTDIDAKSMKAANPKLEHIVVFPGYDSSYVYDNTDTDTDAASNSSATSSKEPSATNNGTAAGTTTANGKISDVVSTGVVTGAVFGMVVLAISGAVVLLARKRRNS